jgi:hypothetical protein
MPTLYDHDQQLFNADQDRERLSIDYYIANPIARPHLQQVLRLNGLGVWFATRLPTKLLVPNGTPITGLPGDVDLIGGLLHPDGDFEAAIAEARKKFPEDADPSWWYQSAAATTSPVWPPRVDFLVATEVKAAALKESGDMKVKERVIEHGRAQARGLVQLGFDLVALGWLASTEPVAVVGTNAAQFFMASERAFLAEQRVQRRAYPTSAEQFGEFVFPIGAVPGRSELMSGAVLRPTVMREAEPIPLGSGTSVAKMRAHVEAALKSMFARLPRPTSLGPVVMRVCRKGTCAEVFLRAPADTTGCPRCGEAAA